MTTATTHTLVGLFPDVAHAKMAVHDLTTEGFSHDQISIIATDGRTGATSADVPDLGPQPETGSDISAGAGAAVGGLAGFIGGILALAIPGIGPIIAAGPLAAGIMGAGIGAATGGIIGALKGAGIPEEHGEKYSEAIRRGRVLVTVATTEAQVDHASDVLDRNGAIDVDEPEEHAIPAPAATGVSDQIKPRPAGEVIRMGPEDSVREKQKQRERKINVYPGITGGGNMTPGT
jgi:hypothetical protein